MYVAVICAFMLFNFFHIPREERMLRELFGERYLAYSTKVRRWL
jgi:protein-S-isoprenylcysteine O-methyltransferase Ste14